MENKYTLRYTIIKWKSKKSNQVRHLKYSFTSENDFLASVDEALNKIYDDNQDADEIIFRNFELNNAEAQYALLLKQHEAHHEKANV